MDHCLHIYLWDPLYHHCLKILVYHQFLKFTWNGSNKYDHIIGQIFLVQIDMIDKLKLARLDHADKIKR